MWLCKKKKKGGEWGRVGARDCSVNPVGPRPARRLFPLPVSGSGNIWWRPKSANNAAIQHVIPLLSEETLRYEDILKNRLLKKKATPPRVQTKTTAMGAAVANSSTQWGQKPKTLGRSRGGGATLTSNEKDQDLPPDTTEKLFIWKPNKFCCNTQCGMSKVYYDTC